METGGREPVTPSVALDGKEWLLSAEDGAFSMLSMHGPPSSCFSLSESKRIATLFLRRQMLAVPAPAQPADDLYWLDCAPNSDIKLIPIDKSNLGGAATPGVLLCWGDGGCAALMALGDAAGCAHLGVVVLPASPSMEACLSKLAATCEPFGLQQRVLWRGILGAAVKPDDARFLVAIVSPSGAVCPGFELGPFSLNFDFADLNAQHPVRICIASNNIADWVRNGVGTLHRSLAEFLAARGNDVTVFYTGHHANAADQQRITEEYRALNIRVATLERGTYGRERTPDVERSVEVYQWLKERDGEFDVIVFSECQAHGFHSLAAKKAGIAFARTLLAVGPHGSLRWCREGMQSPLTGVQDLALNAAEEHMAEWADVVMSPTQHMLGWIQSSGWRVATRHFVHQTVLPVDAPRLAQFAEAGVLWPAGDRHDAAIREIVFFGRLETRKGLRLFVNAVSLLQLQSKWPADIKVTFLGEPGNVEGLSSNEYLARRCARWNCEWQTIDHLHQREALEYLREPGRLVVIPSVQDNLPNTVFECLALRIPLLTTWVGGIPEMIAADDLPHCVCEFDEDGVGLAHKLAQILAGGRISPAQFACDPVANAEAIHRWLGRAKASLTAAVAPTPAAEHPGALDAVILGDDPAWCADTLHSLRKMLPQGDSIAFWGKNDDLRYGFGSAWDSETGAEAFSIRMVLDQLGLTSSSRPCVLIQGGVMLDDRFADGIARLAGRDLNEPVALQVRGEPRPEWPHKHGWLPAGCVPIGAEALLTTLGNHCGKVIFVPAPVRCRLRWSCPDVDGSLFDRVIVGMMPEFRRLLPVAEMVGEISPHALPAELMRPRGLHFGWLRHLRHLSVHETHPVSTLAAWSRIMQESIFIRDRQLEEARTEAKQNRRSEQLALKYVGQGVQLLRRGLGIRWILPAWRRRARAWLRSCGPGGRDRPAADADGRAQK